MGARAERPWLTSVGFAVPKIALHRHVYFHTRTKWTLGSLNRLGVSVVWTSYRRAAER